MIFALRFAFILFSFPIFLFLTEQQTRAWTIAKIKGNVELIRGENTSPAQVKTDLQSNDLIITGRNSRVLLIEGESKLWISQRSRLKVSTLSRPDGGPGTIDVSYGKIRALIKEEQAQKYLYKVESAVVGVRGTEFFTHSDKSGQTICTLEGQVEATLRDGRKIQINEGQGLNLRLGQAPRLNPNSDFLVAQWVSDTSFEAERPAVSLDYKQRAGVQQAGESSLYWGAASTLHYCSSINADFDSQLEDNRSCFRAHLRPVLQYGRSTKLFFEPLINIYQTNTQTQIDNFPALTGNNRTTVTAANAYIERPLDEWTWRLGYQTIEWNDGLLFSERQWSPEPVTHLGLRAMGSLAGWKVDFVVTDAHERSEPLDGHTQISIVGANFSIPDDSGSLFVAHTNFGEHHSGKSPYAFGHEIVNVGLFTKHRWSRSDLKFTILYQDHVRHVDGSGIKGAVQDGMGEFEFGFYPMESRPLRLGVKLISAGNNYVPVLEDYYTLGMSGVISSRSNLTQYCVIAR
ncbi:MAG: FecR domain-containing protein, partial [Bdellovibrionales bacterium]|nr:FecR domain-containing protein [Bdellovibrionales bacterium]